MKFSVSVYSFMQYIQDGRLTPFSCIEKVKEMGFEIGRASCRERV